jgi:5-methylcytosine-specific restriction endonuclease McrA
MGESAVTTKRVGLSKKTRFEVFKRDGFKCMYRGICWNKVREQEQPVMPDVMPWE